jgi:hypothetical protein
MAKKKRKAIKSRNPYALHASRRKAGYMKDRREPRAGQKNMQAAYQDENEA